MRESDQRFALAVLGSNDGIWDWDVVSDDMFVSERAQSLYGLVPGITIRPRLQWLSMVSLHPDDAAIQSELIEDYLTARAPKYEGEWRILQSDGRYHWIQTRGVCVRDQTGNVIRMAGSVSEIDSRKRAEAALHHGQRLEALGTLAGGIAHDFNNILGAIVGFGDMARRSTRAGSRARRDVEFILTAGERGRSLVERLLTFSGSGLGARIAVNVESVVREAIALLTASLPTNVRAELVLETGTAATIGDATQLHQVVMNLATNAIQAMPNGGVMGITLSNAHVDQALVATTGTVACGEYLVLQVNDTGPGMAPDVVERIFDPFFTTKEIGSGTGLGLSLVHGIVSDLGGAVDVHTVVGVGSRFTVYLPRVGNAQEADIQKQAQPPVRRGAHEQILLVDDEESLVRLMSDTLTLLGYVPVGFTSGAEAIAAFAAHPERFDAVVTDERMPGMSGSEMITILRRIRPTVPVLLVSGYLGPQVMRRAREAGANAMLGKPVDNAELADTLARLLEAPPAATREPLEQARPAMPSDRSTPAEVQAAGKPCPVDTPVSLASRSPFDIPAP